jgi:ABC-type multidrug transport system fused ATPase/permease subunit
MDELQTTQYAKEIRSYQMSGWLTRKTDEVLMGMYHVVKKVSGIQLRSQGVITSLNVAQDAFVYAYVGWLTLAGRILVGDFVMFINAVTAFTTALQNISTNYLIIKEAGIYLQELVAFLSLKQEVAGEKIPVKNAEGQWVLEFRDVWFRYPNQEIFVLKNINVTLSGQETVAIVGDNGAGKSTFVKLLLGLYRPSKGEILLNGVNIWDCQIEEYRKLFGAVFQDHKTFAFTVQDNIVMDKKREEEAAAVREALKIGGLWQKIEKLPQGMNQPISRQFSDSGVEFSGGELQQLLIAQAFYRDAPILVFDEPTSNLSPQEENRIFQYLAQLSSHRLSVIISHRMSCCTMCARVLVFQDGKIRSSGTHEELMEQDSYYNQMFQLQAQYYLDMVNLE